MEEPASQKSPTRRINITVSDCRDCPFLGTKTVQDYCPDIAFGYYCERSSNNKEHFLLEECDDTYPKDTLEERDYGIPIPENCPLPEE